MFRRCGRIAGLRRLFHSVVLLLTACLASCQQTARTTPMPAGPTSEKLATVLSAQSSFTEMATPLPFPAIDEGLVGRWQRLDTTGGGGQTAIAVHPTDPNVAYMASDNGGLFLTENGGTRWVSVSSNLGAYRLGFVVLDPLNPDVIYVTASTDYGAFAAGGSTGEIYRSVDGGLSWRFVSDAMGFQSSFPSQSSLVIPCDPAHPDRFDRDRDRLSDVIVVGAWGGPAHSAVGGIWRSEDEGRTFAHLALREENITTLRAFAGDVNVLFAATYAGRVFRSQDLGESWFEITGNLPLVHVTDLAVHPTDEGTLYVTGLRGQPSVPPVWRTTDGGQSWEATSKGLNADGIPEFPKILIDRLDPDTLYVTTRHAPHDKGGVYKSVDKGGSWHLMPARFVLPDGRPWFWYQFEGGLAIAQAVDGRLLADGGGGWRFPDGDLGDGREQWEPASIGVGNVHVNAIAVDPFDDTVLYQGISDFGPYKSVDRGASFHRILGNGWPVTADNYVWNGPYYSRYRMCQIRCSSTCKETGRVAAGGTTDFAVSRQDSAIVYSAFGSGSGRSKHGGVNKSTDGGETWQPVGFQQSNGFKLNPETCVPYGFRHLAIHPADHNIVFAAMELASDGGILYKTTDGGANWSEVFATTSYVTGIDISAADPDLVVLSTRQDVLKSQHQGDVDSWEKITPPDGASFRTVRVSPHRAHVFVVGTNDQGVYYTADGGESWQSNPLEDLFEQKRYQGSSNELSPEVAAAINPGIRTPRNISAIVFDPVAPDTFYVAGTKNARASFGVARITGAGQKWEHLPLDGLTHRNVYDLAVDSIGIFLYAGTFNGTYRLRLR